MDCVTLDGGVLEGGGQILRNAATLACIFGKAIRVHNIRAGRSKPGLRPQHLLGLELIRDICDGKLEGGAIGSTDITLIPGKIKSGTFKADPKTAGSVCLLSQVAIPCLLFAPLASKLQLKGGTDCDFAPPFDFQTMVFQHMVERFGVKLNSNVKRRGYYPRGGGEVEITVEPVKCLKSVAMTTRGEISRIFGRAYAAGPLPIKMSHEMADCAISVLKKQLPKVPVQIERVKEPREVATNPGSGIIIVAETSSGCRLAGSGLGKRGVSTEDVGRSAANMLLENLSHGGYVDDYLQDQVIILMALADGESRISCGPITLHTKTAIHVAESMLPVKFEVVENEGDVNFIACKGLSFQNENWQER